MPIESVRRPLPAPIPRDPPQTADYRTTERHAVEVVGGMGHVTAVVLAGGLGTRLRSVVNDRPKVLAEVNGRPFLTYVLDQLWSAGVRHVVLCTGHRASHVYDAVGDSYRDIRLAYSQEASPLGTGGAVALASSLMQSDPVIAMNGDSYCDVAFKRLWDWHRLHKARATLLLMRVQDVGCYGEVKVTDSGKVTSFMEKTGKCAPGFVNGGVYVLSRDFIKAIPENKTSSLERDVFPAWIGRGLYGYQSEGRLLDIGTPESYVQAQVFLANHPLSWSLPLTSLHMCGTKDAG